MSNISSMTGYANAKVQTDMGLLSIDMRSVNSRFLDLSFRASEEIRFLEPKFREIISGKIARGKMECRLNSECRRRAGLWRNGLSLRPASEEP